MPYKSIWETAPAERERIMKYSVVFSSRTGNTAQLVQAVLAALPSEDCIYSGSLDELMQAGEGFRLAGSPISAGRLLDR